MHKARHGWTMLEDDTRTMLRLMEERIRSAQRKMRYWDMLVRLRDHVEADLAALEEERASVEESAEGKRKAQTLRCAPVQDCHRRAVSLVSAATPKPMFFSPRS